MAAKTWEEKEAEYVDSLCEEIAFQRLNPSLGKPVDLERIWACWDELYAAYRDAADTASAEYRLLKEQFEEMSDDCKEQEERAGKAEEEVLDLQDKLTKIEDILRE